jgi:predicted dehydrogenase
MYKIAVIGCGRGGTGVGGHSIGHAHGQHWSRSDRVHIVGACDLNAENLANYVKTFDVEFASESAEEMLAQAKPDIVSICTYVGSHADLVELCARSGVKGIFCEKPMVHSEGDMRRIEAACAASGIKLIVNFCRRPGPLFLAVRKAIVDGTIGARVLYAASLDDWDQMEWGSHWHDMFRFFEGEPDVEWVMGQARATGAKRGYGHVIEEHSVAYAGLAGGARVLLEGGKPHVGDAAIRIVGTLGMLELNWDGTVMLTNAEGRLNIFTGTLHPQDDLPEYKVLTDGLLAWMEGGDEPAYGLTNAIKSTSMYLGSYRSAADGDRIDLPLGGNGGFALDAVASRQAAHIAPT